MTRYGKEIIAIITLKLIALTILWALFFSTPVQDQLTTKTMTSRLLN